MTVEEVLELRPGCLVDARSSPRGRWFAAKVLNVGKINEGHHITKGPWRYIPVRVLKCGINPKTGSPYVTPTETYNELLRLVGKADPAPANVYADWLEEHGEARAAAMLREAFPMTLETAR